MSNENKNNVYQLRPNQSQPEEQTPQRLLGPGQRAKLLLGLVEPEDYGTTYEELDAAKRPMGRRGKAAVAAGAIAGLVVGGAIFGRALDYELDQVERPPVPAMQEEPGRMSGVRPPSTEDGLGVVEYQQPGESTGEGPLEEIPSSEE